MQRQAPVNPGPVPECPPQTCDKIVIFDEIDNGDNDIEKRHRQYDSLSLRDLQEYNDRHINAHLWGYLHPLGAAFAQLDFLNLCPTYYIGRNAPEDPLDPWIVLHGTRIGEGFA